MLNFRNRGLSLIELMVGLTVGLFIVLASTQIYVSAARGGVDSTRANRLNQDLRSVLNIVMADIRRAGYWATTNNNTPNPFTDTNRNIAMTPNCVVYSYDATWNGGTAGTVDPGIDFGGARFANESVQTLRSSTVSSTVGPCSDATAWENLTDPSVIRITSMTFDVTGSKCIAFDASTYNEADPTTYETWTATGGTVNACEATSLGAPSPFPAATKTFVEIRIVRISITAQHAQDSTLSRTISDSVTIRNHRILRP